MKQQTMDIVLCDYNLGKNKDGQQVLEEVRALNLLPYSSIFVLLTAEDTSHMVMGAIEFEPDDYLVKPFQRSLLEARIKKIQEKKKKFNDIYIAMTAKRYDQAIQLCDNLLQDQSAPAFELNKIKGSLLLRLGDYESARDFYDGVLRQRDVIWARLGLGHAHFALKAYDDAQKTFESIIRDNPMCVEAHDWLAKIHKARGDKQACQDALTTATSISPKTIQRQRALAEIAYENTDLETAEKAFKAVLKEGKHSCHRSPTDFGGLAQVCLDKGDNQNAVKLVTDMTREFKVDDNAVQAKAALVEARVYQATGQTGQSLQALEKVMKLYRENPSVLPASAALDLVETAHALDRPAFGEELLKHVVRNSGEDEAMLDKVKDVCARSGLTALADIIETTRREVVATNNEGVELAKQGKYKEAIALFMNAVRSMPENITINLNVATSFMAAMHNNGMDDRFRQQAELYLSKARDIDPGNERVKKMQAMLRQLTAASPA
jgi:tetratricopeptide (TPR) repeat protein